MQMRAHVYMLLYTCARYMRAVTSGLHRASSQGSPTCSLVVACAVYDGADGLVVAWYLSQLGEVGANLGES